MTAIRTFGVWLAAALSGGAALAYEIGWSRALVVPLGNSTDAAALVLAGFMLGMAGGARLGGGLSERVSSPLRLYALLELVLGLYALVAPRLIWLLASIPAECSAGAIAPGVLLRYLAGFALIAAPSLAMGATLPLLVRALTDQRSSLRLQVGIAYGANTGGAAAGAFVTGFWGIALLGIGGCSAAAAAASLTAAAVARLAGWGVAAARTQQRSREQPSAPTATSPGLRRLALAAAFVSGLVMLACEMLWTRVLTFVFGHDGYAFATLLAFVLVGLAIGGMLHRLVARIDQRRLLAALLGLFAVAELLCFWAAAWLVTRYGRDPLDLQAAGSLAGSVWLELYRELVFVPLLVLVPSVLSGMVFPAACSLYGEHARHAGLSVGVIFLVNGVGSALGALWAAFGLVATAGIQNACFVLALLCAATAAALILQRHGRHTKQLVAVALSPLAATAALAATIPSQLPKQMLLQAVGPRHQRLLHYEEARTGTVSVIENQINGERQLLINAVNEVTTRLVHDQSFKLLGHLAPLLHEKPRRGVMICLGAGLSAGAALTHPLQRLDVVDLSSAVVHGARYFESENNRVLSDPRFHLHIADGRQFLLNSPGGYDVAIVDSTHPKAVDSWILYTREFYTLLRSRLARGGIAVQWVPLHGLSEREFKTIVATFQQAFAQMSLWANVGFETYGQVGYAKLIGRCDTEVELDYDELAQRLSATRIKQDLAAYGMSSPEELLDLFVAGPRALRAWTEGLQVQTDEHPSIVYLNPSPGDRPMLPNLLLTVREPVARFLRRVRVSRPHAQERLRRAYQAQGLVMAGLLERAAKLRPEGTKIQLFVRQAASTPSYYRALADRYATDPDRLFEAGTQLGTLGHLTQARHVLERAEMLDPQDFRIQLNLALLLADLGNQPAAVARLSRLRQEYPTSAIAHQNLGTVLLSQGDASAAASHLRQALAWDPTNLGAQTALGQAYLEAGELSQGRAVLEELLTQNPWVAEAHDLLGLLAHAEGAYRKAVQHHTRAVELNAYRASFHHNLGVALQASGALTQAAAAYRAALEIDPEHAVALNNLGLIRARQGRLQLAADLYVAALHADPDYAAAAHNLGLALAGQSRRQDAIQAFCLARRLDPNLEAPSQQLARLGAKAQDCLPRQ